MAAAGTSPLAAPPPTPTVRWRREFPGHMRELGALRHWLASVLPPCPALTDVLSVATELGSNAVRHSASGRGGTFMVEVTWRGVVRVAVADGGAPDGPRVIEDPDAEHGRGLLMVRGLSLRSGAYGDVRGRVVWADLAWDGPPPNPLPQDGGADAGGAEAENDATALTRRFGVPVWVGQFTMQWWALTGRELVSAPSAHELAALLTRQLNTR